MLLRVQYNEVLEMTTGCSNEEISGDLDKNSFGSSGMRERKWEGDVL